MKLTHLEIARTAHEINRSYCIAIGDDSQKPWDESPDWQKDSAVDGIAFTLGHPDATPRDSHESWKKFKLADGWKYGEVKDAEKKEHPCMVEYEHLPLSQRIKDNLFQTTVRTLASL